MTTATNENKINRISNAIIILKKIKNPIGFII